MTAVLEGTRDAWAQATLIIDVVILILSAGVIVLRAFGSPRPCLRSGLEWGALVITAAACLSCATAQDKRPAINASIDLLSALALCICLIQVCDRWSRIRLALCVIIASGVANAAECFNQHFISFIETEQMYRDSREEIWSSQGVPLDSPQVLLYEQRMQSREASGFFTHSNVAGGYMLLPAFAALGLATASPDGQKRRRRLPETAAFAALTLVLLVAGVLTKSKGAAVALAAGLLLVATCAIGGRRISRPRRALFASGWMVVLASTISVVVVGVTRGGLPHPSLDFRWKYWTAAAEMFRDNWLFGVGAENFGDYYVGYKTIASPEEVKNPHNFVVQFATEYGIGGLIGVVLLLLGASACVTGRRNGPADSADQDVGAGTAGTRPGPQARWPSALIVLAVAVFLPRTVMLPSDQPALIVWETAFALTFWAAAFATVSIALRQSAGTAWIRAVSCGLFAFLLQDCVNFGLFVPGARTTFFALLAVAIAGRKAASGTAFRAGPSSRSQRWTAVVMAAVALAAVATIGPAMQAERALRRARSACAMPAMDVESHPAHLLFLEATRLDELDSTAPTEHARWLHRLAFGSADSARAYQVAENGLHAVETALERAPRRFWLWGLAAQLHLVRGKASGSSSEYEAAAAAMRHAIELYPSRPMSYVEFGDCLVAVGSCQTIKEGQANFRKALRLDEDRPSWERFQRFSEATKQAIWRRIDEAGEAYSRECADGTLRP